MFTGAHLLFNLPFLSRAVSKTAAAPIERIKLLIQNQVRFAKGGNRNSDELRPQIPKQAQAVTEVVCV